MANYAFNTSPAEERAISIAVAKFNASQLDGTTLTNAQFLKRRVDHQLDQLVDAMRNDRRSALEQKYEDANAATKAAVDTALGYTE